ncbi:MAG: hypothetical protein IIZ39_12480, partial [Blautia sp.]|nr:hypothetical protein [Blautia sp.]
IGKMRDMSLSFLKIPVDSIVNLPDNGVMQNGGSICDLWAFSFSCISQIAERWLRLDLSRRGEEQDTEVVAKSKNVLQRQICLHVYSRRL